MILVMVLIGHRIDIATGKDFIKDAVIIGHIINETVSLIENMGLMGVYIPPVIQIAIDILRVREEDVQEEPYSKKISLSSRGAFIRDEH